MCDTTAFPVTAPRSWTGEPSPQSTLKPLIALPLLVAAVTANVNDDGRPAVGAVVGGVITSVGAPATLMVVVADVVPELEPPPVLPPVLPPLVPPPLVPPLLGGAVVEPAAPTLAVTVAVVVVKSVVVDTPFLSETAMTCDSVPDVVEKLTGAEDNALPLMSKTLAVMVVEPPVGGRVVRLALRLTRPTAAV